MCFNSSYANYAGYGKRNTILCLFYLGDTEEGKQSDVVRVEV